MGDAHMQVFLDHMLSSGFQAVMQEPVTDKTTKNFGSFNYITMAVELLNHFYLNTGCFRDQRFTKELELSLLKLIGNVVRCAVSVYNDLRNLIETPFEDRTYRDTLEKLFALKRWRTLGEKMPPSYEELREGRYHFIRELALEVLRLLWSKYYILLNTAKELKLSYIEPQLVFLISLIEGIQKRLDVLNGTYQTEAGKYGKPPNGHFAFNSGDFYAYETNQEYPGRETNIPPSAEFTASPSSTPGASSTPKPSSTPKSSSTPQTPPVPGDSSRVPQYGEPGFDSGTRVKKPVVHIDFTQNKWKNHRGKEQMGVASAYVNIWTNKPSGTFYFETMPKGKGFAYKEALLFRFKERAYLVNDYTSYDQYDPGLKQFLLLLLGIKEGATEEESLLIIQKQYLKFCVHLHPDKNREIKVPRPDVEELLKAMKEEAIKNAKNEKELNELEIKKTKVQEKLDELQIKKVEIQEELDKLNTEKSWPEKFAEFTGIVNEAFSALNSAKNWLDARFEPKNVPL